MKCNGKKSLYVKPNMYAIHATQVQLCKNNCCAIPLQQVYNYYCNVMLALIYIATPWQMWVWQKHVNAYN
jgi:hypothetical protein